MITIFSRSQPYAVLPLTFKATIGIQNCELWQEQGASYETAIGIKHCPPVNSVYKGTAQVNFDALYAPNVIYKGVQYTPDELKKMREWVKDCQWSEDYADGEIDQLTPLTILKGVDKHYCGGLIAFKQEVQQGIM